MTGRRTALDHALDLKRAGRLDEAVIALEAVLARTPGNPVALTHLAETQLRRRRLADAADALDRAEALAGTTAFTARVRSDLRYREQRWRDDGAGGAWLALGEVARREDRVADALEMFERAHASAPDDDFAYAKLIEARLVSMPPDAREREIEVLMRSRTNNRHLLGVLARVRSESGDEERAASAWRTRREAHGGENPSWGRGPGGRYHHGGTSLEECVVPVATFTVAAPA